MFSGLVTHLGSVGAIEKHTEVTLRIHQEEIVETLNIGDSISCNGICLTVVRTHTTASPWFEVQASQETQNKSNVNHWHVGTLINLERPLRVGDELGGHIVLGHVDGVAEITQIEPVGHSQRYEFTNSSPIQPFIAPKGSVAINGVSLTVNDVSPQHFSVNLIPHTLQVTAFSNAQVGDRVNIEIDPIARYVKQILQSGT